MDISWDTGRSLSKNVHGTFLVTKLICSAPLGFVLGLLVPDQEMVVAPELFCLVASLDCFRAA